MAIIAASDYKTWKGISATTWDAQLAVMVPAAQAMAERFCDRAFDYNAAYSETVDGTGSLYLFISNTPIASITSVTRILDDGSTETVDSSAYRKGHADTGTVVRLGSGWGDCRSRWTEGVQNYTVVYAGGYGSPGPAVPADLKVALYQLIDQWLADSPGGGLGPQFQSENLGDYSYTRFAASDEFAVVRAALMPYRRGVP